MSSLNKKETLARLNSLTKWKPGALELLGEVSESAVSLEMLHYGRRNGARYVGQVREENGKVQLIGKFVTSYFQRAAVSFILFYLIMVLIIGFYKTVEGIASTGFNLDLLGIRIVATMIGMSVLFLALLIYPAASDVKVISNAIRQIL